MPQHHVSVAGVVVDPEGRVLAVRRRDNGAWELPGGVLERGELIEDGLAREIKEEAGVLVDVVGLSGVYKHMARGIVAIVFHCELAHELETEWAETVGVRWMDRIEVADRMTPVFAQRVLDALDRGSNSAPAVRHHDGGSFIPPLHMSIANKHRSRRRLIWDAPHTAVHSCPPSARTTIRMAAVVTFVWLLSFIVA